MEYTAWLLSALRFRAAQHGHPWQSPWSQEVAADLGLDLGTVPAGQSVGEHLSTLPAPELSKGLEHVWS